jgi:hypothetical protein
VPSSRTPRPRIVGYSLADRSVGLGSTSEDYALNVHLDDLNADFWFAEDLVEHVNNAAGSSPRTELTKNGCAYRTATGKCDALQQ